VDLARAEVEQEAHLRSTQGVYEPMFGGRRRHPWRRCHLGGDKLARAFRPSPYFELIEGRQPSRRCALFGQLHEETGL
jgi:hypothetical protein